MLRKSLISLAILTLLAEPARAGRNETVGLTTALVRRTGMSEAQARDQVDRVFAVLRAELKAGTRIEVRDFGTFSIRERAVRRKKSALSAEPTPLPEKRKYPHFLAAERLKIEVNLRKR